MKTERSCEKPTTLWHHESGYQTALGDGGKQHYASVPKEHGSECWQIVNSLRVAMDTADVIVAHNVAFDKNIIGQSLPG